MVPPAPMTTRPRGASTDPLTRMSSARSVTPSGAVTLPSTVIGVPNRAVVPNVVSRPSSSALVSTLVSVEATNCGASTIPVSLTTIPPSARSARLPVELRTPSTDAMLPFVTRWTVVQFAPSADWIRRLPLFATLKRFHSISVGDRTVIVASSPRLLTWQVGIR